MNLKNHSRAASDEDIPKHTSSLKNNPRTNDEFQKLLNHGRKCKDPNTLHELNNSIRKTRKKKKNDYFSNLANNINIANEAKKLEGEVRFCREYPMTKHSNN